MKRFRFFSCIRFFFPLIAALPLLLISFFNPAECREPASTNIPLDSPVYLYLDKLIGLGLITSDIRGIKPYSRAEAARLALEAEQNLEMLEGKSARFAAELVQRVKQLAHREVSIKTGRDEVPSFSVIPFESARLSSVYLDGAARSYERPVHDPGGDGVFGLGSGLRPATPYPSPVQQHGVEGTPLLEGNEGARYLKGVNAQFQFSSAAYLTGYAAALVEPLVLYQRSGDTLVYINKGYLKLGGGSFEVEVGRDAVWLGQGDRTAITLSNNARNLDLLKLSSPEPVIVPYLGALKYALLLSRLDSSDTSGVVRQPWFYAIKLAVKPARPLEIGLNLGRQQGGPGVSNSFGDTVRGLLGGTGADNSNSVAGFDFRLRLPGWRNMELYGELSGEDTASFWPIVESYVAGIYLPNLTSDGRNELRLEYYYGNNILSTNSTFPGGYLYRGMNLGPYQGGAAQQLFVRLTHFFSPRNYLSVDYIQSLRGNRGKVTVNSQGNFDPQGTIQAEEQANAGRITWNFPVSAGLDMSAMYGFERIENFNLRSGIDQNNHLVRISLGFNY